MYSLINAGLLENTVETRNRYLRKAEYRNTDWFKELFPEYGHALAFGKYHVGYRKSAYYASISPFRSGMDEDQQGFPLYGQSQCDV